MNEKTVNFYGREFCVSPDVLIPRPETELIVDIVKSLSGRAFLPGVSKPPRRLPEKPLILDVGTGSGCIAVSLKLEVPEAEVFAVDLSEKALQVAEKNAEKLGAEVKFLKSDLLEVFLSADATEGFSEGATSEKFPEKFDVVVANLPYVDRNWDWLDLEKLSEEPEMALFAGDGGLGIIFRLLSQVQNRTKYLIVEADPCQHNRIVEKAKSQGFKLLEIRGFQIVLESI